MTRRASNLNRCASLVELSPTDNFRLANHLAGIGLYRSAVFAARQVLTLAGQEDQQQSLSAPAYFNHLRYGLYYHDLIINEAQKYGLDPLFMFSVIRQESLFEGFVKSSAGAHGLMQIIPLHWTADRQRAQLAAGVWRLRPVPPPRQRDVRLLLPAENKGYVEWGYIRRPGSL